MPDVVDKVMAQNLKLEKELGGVKQQLKIYKEKYQKVVTPEVVRSWIEKLKKECATQFPYDNTKCVNLGENKKSKIRENKWCFMPTVNSNNPFLQSIVGLLKTSKINKFCKDIISEKIHNSKFEDPNKQTD